MTEKSDIYEVWQKSNETDFLFTKVFVFSNINVIPFKNSSLGQLHTDGDSVPTYGSNAGSLQPVWSSAYLLHSFGCFLKFFYKDVLESLRKRVIHMRPDITDKWMLHHDNTPSHTVLSITEFLTSAPATYSFS